MRLLVLKLPRMLECKLYVTLEVPYIRMSKFIFSHFGSLGHDKNKTIFKIGQWFRQIDQLILMAWCYSRIDELIFTYDLCVMGREIRVLNVPISRAGILLTESNRGPLKKYKHEWKLHFRGKWETKFFMKKAYLETLLSVIQHEKNTQGRLFFFHLIS